jgi:hypothetical protein
MTTTTIKHADKYATTWTANMNLAGCTVRLLATKLGDTVPIVLPSTITDAPNGVVTHVLTGTLLPGKYNVELEVKRAGDGFEGSFPRKGYETLIVEKDLG